MNTSRFKSFGILGASILALGACSFEQPNMFPSGYVNNDREYKSSAPPKSSKFTKLQRKSMGPEQAEQFRSAMYDLVKNLTDRAGMPPRPIFVHTPDPLTPFYSNLDNDLREAMRHMGYTLSQAPEGAYVFAYTAEIIDHQKPVTDGEAITLHDDSEKSNVSVTLHVYDSLGKDAKKLTEETGQYYIEGAEALYIPPGVFSMLPDLD